MSQWLSAHIVDRHDWTSHLFTLKLLCEEFPLYQAGQFVKLACHCDGRRVARAYSLVSAPHQGHLEVLVVLVEEGRLTPKLHQLQVGDSIEVSIPAKGDFTLNHIPQHHNLWLMATGTGVSPFISMLESGEVWRRKGRTFLIYGVRYQSDLAYYEKIQQWLAMYSLNFCFIPVVSREIPDYGIYGRLTALLENQRLEKVCGQSLNALTDSVLLCGNPQMIEDVTGILEGLGLHKYKPKTGGNIFTERYW